MSFWINLKNKIANNYFLVFSFFIGIPLFSIWIVSWINPTFADNDPLGVAMLVSTLTSLGYTLMFFKGTFGIKSLKFVGTIFLIMFIWLWDIDRAGNFMKVMRKSCAYGRSVACEQVGIQNAIEAMPDVEDIEKLEEDLRKDIEMREAIKRKYGG